MLRPMIVLVYPSAMRRTSLSIVALLAIAIAALCHAQSPVEVVFHQSSPYDEVYVVEVDGQRFLRFGSPQGDDQSGMLLADPDRHVLDYIPLTLVGLALAETQDRGLIVGFGAGTTTRTWHRTVPTMHIDSVEIDPVVAAIAFSHFGFEPHESLPIHIMDGRAFVQQVSSRYDAILLDAYGAGDAPAHLTTLEFYREVIGRLAPGGVVMANVVAKEDSTIKAMMRTFCEAFPMVIRIDTPRDGNIVLLGRQDEPLDPILVEQQIAAQATRLGLDDPSAVGSLRALPASLGDAPLLRDPGHAP